MIPTVQFTINTNVAASITINGDSLRPFQIANNLWNYHYPGHAAHRLSTIAKIWENIGLTVTKIYGTILDMPTKGNEYNVQLTLAAHGNGNVFEVVKSIIKYERGTEK